MPAVPWFYRCLLGFGRFTAGCHGIFWMRFGLPASGPTHFYGQGTPDPLRDDVTLQSLEAKSARLQLVVAARGCACVNISEDESRLVFPRAHFEALTEMNPVEFDQDAFEGIKAREHAIGYFVDSGRYWECVDRFDAEALAEIDALWLDAPVR